MADKPRRPEDDNPWLAYAKFTGIGLEVAIAIVVSLYAGSRIDVKYNSSPIGLLACLILGFVVAISVLVKYSRLAGRDMKDGDDAERKK